MYTTTSTSGINHPYTQGSPLRDEQERAIVEAAKQLPSNGSGKLEIWREGGNVRIAEVTRPTARTV